MLKTRKHACLTGPEMTVSAPERPKIPIYAGHDAEGEITNHIIMAKTKNEKKQTGENKVTEEKKFG